MPCNKVRLKSVGRKRKSELCLNDDIDCNNESPKSNSDANAKKICNGTNSLVKGTFLSAGSGSMFPSSLHLALKGTYLTLKQKALLAQAAWIADPQLIGGLGFRQDIIVEWLVGVATRPTKLTSNSSEVSKSNMTDNLLNVQCADVWRTLSFCLGNLNRGWELDPASFNTAFWVSLHARLGDGDIFGVSQFAAEVLIQLLSTELIEIARIPNICQIFFAFLEYLMSKYKSDGFSKVISSSYKTLSTILSVLNRNIQFRPNLVIEVRKLITVDSLSASGCLFLSCVSPDQFCRVAQRELGNEFEILFGFCYFGRKPSVVLSGGGGHVTGREGVIKALSVGDGVVKSLLSLLTPSSVGLETLSPIFPFLFGASCSCFLDGYCDESVVVTLFSTIMNLLPVDRKGSMEVILNLMDQMRNRSVFRSLDVEKVTCTQVLNDLLCNMLADRHLKEPGFLRCAEIIVDLVPHFASKSVDTLVVWLDRHSDIAKRDPALEAAYTSCLHCFISTLGRMKQLKLFVAAISESKDAFISDNFLNCVLLDFGSSIEESHLKQIEECFHGIAKSFSDLIEIPDVSHGRRAGSILKMLDAVVYWTPLVNLEKLGSSFEIQLKNMMDRILTKKSEPKLNSGLAAYLDELFFINFNAWNRLIRFRLSSCNSGALAEATVSDYMAVAVQIPPYDGKLGWRCRIMIGLCAFEICATTDILSSQRFSDVRDQSHATIQEIIFSYDMSCDDSSDDYFEFILKIVRNYQYFESCLSKRCKQRLFSHAIAFSSINEIRRRQFQGVVSADVKDNRNFQILILAASLNLLHEMTVRCQELDLNSSLKLAVLTLPKLSNLICCEESPDLDKIFAVVLKFCRKIMHHFSYDNKSFRNGLDFNSAATDFDRLLWCMGIAFGLPFETSIELQPVLFAASVVLLTLSHVPIGSFDSCRHSAHLSVRLISLALISRCLVMDGLNKCWEMIAESFPSFLELMIDGTVTGVEMNNLDVLESLLSILDRFVLKTPLPRVLLLVQSVVTVVNQCNSWKDAVVFKWKFLEQVSRRMIIDDRFSKDKDASLDADLAKLLAKELQSVKSTGIENIHSDCLAILLSCCALILTKKQSMDDESNSKRTFNLLLSTIVARLKIESFESSSTILDFLNLSVTLSAKPIRTSSEHWQLTTSKLLALLLEHHSTLLKTSWRFPALVDSMVKFASNQLSANPSVDFSFLEICKFRPQKCPALSEEKVVWDVVISKFWLWGCILTAAGKVFCGNVQTELLAKVTRIAYAELTFATVIVLSGDEIRSTIDAQMCLCLAWERLLEASDGRSVASAVVTSAMNAMIALNDVVQEDDLDNFANIFCAKCSLLNLCLKKFPTVVGKQAAVFISVLHLMQMGLLERSEMGIKNANEVGLEESKQKDLLLKCAQWLSRIYLLIHRTSTAQLQRVAPYLIAGYVQAFVLGGSISGEVKGTMMNGVFELMDLLDSNSIALIQSNLDMSPRELFKQLYGDYVKYHKSWIT